MLVDTLRADRLGAYGNKRGMTPFLDELAARGTVFSHAYSASSWTVPSIASLFTSRHAAQHRVTTYESKIGDDEVTVAEKFAAANYATAGFFANFRLLARLGYAQGFGNWEVVLTEPGKTKPRAAMMRRQVRSWLDLSRESRREKPLLLYLHFMEPHGPYNPPEPFRSRFLTTATDEATIEKTNGLLSSINFNMMTPPDMQLLETLYDGEVASVDSELRALFTELRQQGIVDDRSVIVVTADHGEEFKEHGRYSHGYALFEESVRVPLIVLGPGIAPGRVVDRNVSLLDVAPTLLELAGLPPEPAFEGRSLAPLASEPSLWSRIFATKEAPREDVILELPATGSRWDLRAHARGIVRESTKLLVSVARPYQKVEESTQIYDLAADPGESHPNPSTLDDELPALLAALRDRTQALASRAAETAEKGVIDEATKEKLRALGYQP